MAERSAARAASAWLIGCLLAANAAFAVAPPPGPAVPRIQGARVLEAQSFGIAVPDLRNAVLNRSDARIGRFKLDIVTRASARPRDWVFEQTPAPGGRLAVGGTLRLVVSDASLVAVPDVMRDELGAAERQIVRAGLSARLANAPADATSRVRGQSPSAGVEVERGSAVTLFVERTTPPAPTPTPPRPDPIKPTPTPPRPEPVKPTPTPPPAVAELPVPNVVGLTYDEALQRLARFTPQRSHQSSVEPGGQVIAQDPAPPATRAPRAPVSVVLSDGSLTIVPSLAGLADDAAQRRVVEAGLKPQLVREAGDAPIGRVTGQQPAAEQRARRGSVVRVQISAGPREIEVPAVIGLRAEDATARLGRFKVSRSEQSAPAPRGEVVAQRPAGGSRAAPGSAVAITVSAGQESIEVPNVVASDVQSAQQRLAEFRVRIDEVSGAPPRGRVLAQSPAAGALVAPGSQVALSVSDGAAAVAAPVDPTPPATPEPAPPATPVNWWLLAGGGALLLLGAGVAIGRVWPKAKPPRVSAAGSLELAPAEASASGAELDGPTLSLAASFQPGDTTIEPNDPEVR